MIKHAIRAFLLAALLAGAGLWIAFAALAVPDITSTSGSDRDIAVAVKMEEPPEDTFQVDSFEDLADPDARAEIRKKLLRAKLLATSRIGVSFEWLMTSDGHVEIAAEAVIGDINKPEYATEGPLETLEELEAEEDLEFVIILLCDARLDPLELSEGGVVIERGSEAACSDPVSSADEGARQIFTAVDYLTIEGTPLGQWTDRRGGNRLARTPAIGWGEYSSPAYNPYDLVQRLLFGDRHQIFEYAAPNEGSRVSASLGAAAGEFIVNTTLDIPMVDSPSDLNRVVYNEALDTTESMAISWNATENESLQAGVVQWTQPGAAERTQWFTLLSGALLGVAASVAVETVLSIARQTPPAQSHHDAGNRIRPSSVRLGHTPKQLRRHRNHP